MRSSIGPLPPACAAVNRLSINQVQLAVEAALTGDRDLVYAAVAMDPLAAALLTLPQIRRMVDEMIAAQRRWLPALASKTLVTAGAADAARRAAKAVAAKQHRPRSARTRRKA